MDKAMIFWIAVFLVGLAILTMGISGRTVITTQPCKTGTPGCYTETQYVERGWWIFKYTEEVTPSTGTVPVESQQSSPAVQVFGIGLMALSLLFIVRLIVRPTKEVEEKEQIEKKKHKRKSGRYFWEGIILLLILTPLAYILFLPLAIIPLVLGIFDLYRSTQVDEIPEKSEAPKMGESETTNVKEIVYMRCPKCKAKNEEDAVFCKKCGKKL